MLNTTLLKITSLLSKHDIPYMVIGGYAVLYHGEARFTEDIDIVLGVDVDTLDQVLEVINGKFEVRTSNPKDFVTQTNVLPLREKESGIKVDLIFSFIPFEREAIRNAETAKIEGEKVQIIKAEDLIIYKLLSGRPKDVEDAKSVFQLNLKDVDTEEIERNISELSQLLGNDLISKKWDKIKSQSE